MEFLQSDRLNVLNYKKLTDFLSDLYQFRKNEDASFSYEIWAAELDFKSRSMVRMIVKGQIKISSTFTDKILEQLKLNPVQKNYFVLLAHHHNTDVDFLKSTYFNRMIEMSNFIENETEFADYSHFLSHIEIPAIHILISYEDFKASIAELHEVTGFPVEKIEMQLELLHKMGLAVPLQDAADQEIYWRSNNKNFTLNSDKEKKSLDTFHRHTMGEVLSALDTDARDDKKFRSIYFTVDQDGYESLSEEIEGFLQKVKNKYMTKQFSQKNLYKLNLQTYPLTKK